VKQTLNYRILSLSGQGQFGKVFVAIAKNSGKMFALKELNQKHLSTSGFLRELHFLVSLNHQNIVNCQALEHYQNNRYLVMEYCEGGTLRNLINSSFQLTLNQSLKLIIDVLQGLQYAHDRGIIHRDLKPENILLKISDRNWTAHISDFGIAKLVQEINPQVNMGDTGSPAYMSPEQFYGQYSYSCDLYAVGVMLYELVMGERPFSGMPKDLLSAHINQPVTIPPSVPFLLRSAIAKSLQKLPHRRFPTASAMAEALQLARDILPTEYYYSPLSPTADNQLQLLALISTEPLPQPIHQLAVASGQIYLGAAEDVYINRYQDSNLSGEPIQQWKISLDNLISQLEVKAEGCFVTTKSSLYYLPLDITTEKFHFFAQTFLPIACFPTDSLVSDIEPQGKWFSVSYLPHKSQTPSWEIWELPNCQLRRSQINRRRWDQLIILNKRYGLGIYQNKQQHTEFYLFNRRGSWLAKYLLPIQLKQLVYNPQFGNQLLAIEKNNLNAVILITLKGFKIQRISLGTTPRLIVACPQGYLISDRDCNLTLIDGQNLSLKQFQIPITASTVTAITSSPTQLLVATTTLNQFQLHKLELPNQ
jgi:serine/threonine protein kinase